MLDLDPDINDFGSPTPKILHNLIQFKQMSLLRILLHFLIFSQLYDSMFASSQPEVSATFIQDYTHSLLKIFNQKLF